MINEANVYYKLNLIVFLNQPNNVNNESTLLHLLFPRDQEPLCYAKKNLSVTWWKVEGGADESDVPTELRVVH